MFSNAIRLSSFQRNHYRHLSTAHNKALDIFSLYDEPKLYDHAFSFRAFKNEAKFVLNAFKQYSAPNSSISSCLELACGPARHSLHLHLLGVNNITCLDINKSMLSYSRSIFPKAPVEEGRIQFVQQDMSNFHVNRKYDLIICMIGSFAHLHSNLDAISCFKSVSKHLRKNGFFIIEVGGPKQIFSGGLFPSFASIETWDIKLSLSDILQVQWGDKEDVFDIISQVAHRSVYYSLIRDNKRISTKKNILKLRQYTIQELCIFAEVSGLRFRAIHGDCNIDCININNADRVSLLFEKL